MRWSHKCRHVKIPNTDNMILKLDDWQSRSFGEWIESCPHCSKTNPYHQPASTEPTQADRDIAVMRASIVSYKEGKNGIERHPGNTAHENAAWEWGRKDGGWDGKH